MGGLISGIYGRSGMRPVSEQAKQASGWNKPTKKLRRKKSNPLPRTKWPAPVADRVWLDVPYKHHWRAKRKGAHWDAKEKCWYAPFPTPVDVRIGLRKWWPKEAETTPR